jgi:site-specific DNA recombinase
MQGYVQENAVAAIRVSSIKQGLQGDSPEDQKQQIERFAANHNIKIKKFFIFIESASKEEQPVQEAIDYCTNKQNNIQLCIIKSIDRFTRGGSYLYDHLKMQLEHSSVQLIDIYGIIGKQQVNTLDHLNVEYKWSIYSPTKKAEILEAERAKDEMRDIMTRMIGAEIRYVRMGYRVRQPPFGYQNTKIETNHGKRVILVPIPEEAALVRKMFDLRIQGTLNDTEIVDELNKLGFRTRTTYKRHPKDKTKVIGKRGGVPLSVKQFWRYLANPIFAGISTEKWTQGKPVKGNFDGIVSVDTFNQANRGKITIYDSGGEIKIYKDRPPEYLLNKKLINPEFPYKKHVLCPHCKKPLYGSASKGKLGKYYPAYHCHHRGHYFRVPAKEFEQTIESFIKGLNVTPQYVEKLKKYVLDMWNKRQSSTKKDSETIEAKISELRASAKACVEKIRFLSSQVAIRYMEEDILAIEKEILELEKSKHQKQVQETNMELVMENVGYFLEHLEELILNSKKPLKQAEYFSLLFDSVPTYEDLSFGTPKLAPFLGIKKELETIQLPKGDPTESRTPLYRMRTCRPSR